MRISRQILDQMVAHAREEAPNECCGMIGSRDGTAVALYPTANAKASPLSFEIDSRDQIRAWRDLEERGEELGAIYHSHTKSPAYPSQTDVNQARHWPEPLWVIVSLAGDSPDVRAFAIRDGQIEEAELVVE